MRILALVLFAFVGGCTHVVSAEDVMWCMSRCDDDPQIGAEYDGEWRLHTIAHKSGVLEVGRNSLTGHRCCRCADGRVVKQHQMGEIVTRDPKERIYQ